MNISPHSAGQRAYERDLEIQPNYEDGTPRRPWDELPKIYRDTWEKKGKSHPRYYVEIDGIRDTCYIRDRANPNKNRSRIAFLIGTSRRTVNKANTIVDALNLYEEGQS